MEIIAEYLAVGAVAGVLAGLLGIGGGIVVVPALLYFFHLAHFPGQMVMHMAVGSSLATVVFTSMASSYAHHRRGAVLWPTVTRLVPGIVLGAWLGAAIADYLPGNVLRTVFGCFELLVAVQIIFGFKPAAHRSLPSTPGLSAAGGVIGAISSILGIGGGTLTVPFLLYCNVAIREAVASSAACGLPIALAGTIGFVVTGWGNPLLPSGSTGYIYWPAVGGIAAASLMAAPLGAWLAHTLPVATVKRAFAVLLVVVGLRILL